MKKSFFCFVLLFIIGVVFAINYAKPVVSFASATQSDDKYSAKSLYLMDYNSGQVLYEKNANDKIPVASIVKLMTILLTCENIENKNLSLEDKVTASYNASSMGGSQVFIEEGGEYSIGDLLKSTIVSSANDASVLLAETIAGSEEDFVTLMNKRAKELNLTNTNYVNCTGLPAGNQFSCASDTAKLLKEVTKHDAYHKYSTIWIDTLKHPKGRETELVNTNKLIRYFEGCDGGKTGSTNEAGYCLSATAKRGGTRLIGVVLGAENGKARFSETSKLLNYGFSNFESKLAVDSKINLKDKVSVKSGREENVSVKPLNDVYVLVNKHSNEKIQVDVKLNSSVKAPIKSGAILGKIYVIKNGEVIAETDAISVEDVAKNNILDSFEKTINNWALI